MKYADAGVNIAVADDGEATHSPSRQPHIHARSAGRHRRIRRAVCAGLKKWKEPCWFRARTAWAPKLKVAMAMGVHSTVGGDLVNHCINDILVQGAEPLFFLDYLAMGKLEPQVVEQLVDGMSRACRKAGCALIGGETAEMPGFYPGANTMSRDLLSAWSSAKIC